MKEEKLRILQVHNYYQIPGGEDQVVKNESNLLKAHGHKVWLYKRSNGEISKMGLLDRIALPFAACFSLKTYREVKKLIWEREIDVVHVHNTVPLISPSVFYAAFVSNTPVVMTVHNYRLFCPSGICYRNHQICQECMQKGLYRSVRHKCYRGSRIQTCVLATSMQLHRILRTYSKLHYICLTEFNKDKLLGFKQIKPENVFVKPNYTEANKEIIPLEYRENMVVYAGRLEESKGILVLLKAYKELQETCEKDALACIPKLFICGEGGLEKVCKNYIEKNHLTRVEFMGKFSNEQVKSLMAKAKAIILPSLWYEGFPMNLAEGYALHTPVIGSDIGNVGDLIAEGKNGWKFKAGNASELAEKIKHCNPSICEFELADANLWEANENYERLVEIYKRCIEHVRNEEE